MLTDILSDLSIPCTPKIKQGCFKNGDCVEVFLPPSNVRLHLPSEQVCWIERKSIDAQKGGLAVFRRF